MLGGEKSYTQSLKVHKNEVIPLNANLHVVLFKDFFCWFLKQK